MATVLLLLHGLLPLAAQELTPTEGYLARFSRALPRATRAQVPLNVDFPDGASTQACPVTFGVPFPRGALDSAEHVRLVEDGEEVPASIRCTATWERPEGDVKWLLIDATVAPGRKYALEYGGEVRGAEHLAGVRVEDEGPGISVSTGPLKFTVPRDRAALIDAAWLDADGNAAFEDGECVLPSGSSPAPFMVDDQGTRYALTPSDGYEVTVEQAGPLHAIIKAEGWYTSEAGQRLCQHIARLHAYAGHAFVRVEHTFVVAFDTDKVRVRDIAIPLALNLTQPKAMFGLEQGEAAQTPSAAYLVQDDAEYFGLRTAGGEVLAEGQRAAGWVDCSDGRQGLTVGIRHMWQEYPRELEFTGESVVAHLWPLHHDRPLDFGARAVLGPELYAAWDQVYWQNWYEGGLDQYDQAFGLAKSNDLLIAFHGEDGTRAVELCRTLDEPVIVAASPESMCRSDVMGPIHPQDAERFPEEERKMDLGFERFQWLREHLGNYGLIDYGDVNYVVNFDEERGRWLPRPWRRWASRFYGHPVMPWVQFLRSGRRDYLEWGIDNARHVMDIDMCHVTNEELGKHRGGRYGGNGGILHYAGNIYDIGCDSHIDHLLLLYYLTGYRRAWDVLQEEAGFYLWKDTQPGGALHSYAHRMTGGAMRTMIALYGATWDERTLDIARRMADFCYENQDGDGVIRHDDVYMLPGMFTYYQATGDERMKELILRCMEREAKVGRNESDPRSFGFYGLSMAYFLTGDPSYLRWAERWRREFVERVQDTDDALWRGQPKGEWDYCHLTLHLLYMPYYLEALSALTQPVQPATKDNAVTSGEIVLWREQAKPFTAVAEWFCYDPAYSTGVSVACLDRYLTRHPTRARVVLSGPNEREVAGAPVVFAEGQKSCKVLIEAPQGPPGAYHLGIWNPGGLHFKLRLASSDIAQWAYTMQGEYVACADAYYFQVPEETEHLELAFKTLALRRPVAFAVRDSRGQARKEEEITFGATPMSEYRTWSFDVPPEERGKLWQFSVTPSSPEVEQTYLKLAGLPPIIWTSPEAFFVPNEDAVRSRDTLIVAHPALPYPEAGECLQVEPGKPLEIPRGPAAEGDAYANLDPRQGTLEFWFRPQWAPDDISDRTIARCGQMRLYRRSRLGAYFALGGTRQSGLVTESGYWYHLAATWDAGGPDRPPETQLFINGIKTGSMMGAAKEALGDWTSDPLTIGGEVAFTIDDVRISDTIRYTDDFDPPVPPTADEHTLFLERF